MTGESEFCEVFFDEVRAAIAFHSRSATIAVNAPR